MIGFIVGLLLGLLLMWLIARQLAINLRAQRALTRKLLEERGKDLELVNSLLAVVENYQQRKAVELKEPAAQKVYAA